MRSKSQVFPQNWYFWNISCYKVPIHLKISAILNIVKLQYWSCIFFLIVLKLGSKGQNWPKNQHFLNIWRSLYQFIHFLHKVRTKWRLQTGISVIPKILVYTDSWSQKVEFLCEIDILHDISCFKFIWNFFLFNYNGKSFNVFLHVLTILLIFCMIMTVIINGI